jgi:FtsZ-binding cell division protein ZapB
VTVPDRSAALINIVSRKIDGRDVFLFREPQSNQAPFRAVLLRNGKESALESGPITLYVDGTFAGEGFIGRVGKDETAFVPYARESGFSLQVQSDARIDELRLVRITGGRIHLQGKRVSTRTVRIESNRDQPSLAYVRLRRQSGMDLVNPPKDLVKAGDDLFVPVLVPAKSQASAALVEQTPVTMVEAGLTNPVMQALRYYLQNSKPEEAIAGPITELLTHQAEIENLALTMQGLAQQRDTLDREQQRIQGNLDALPPGAVAADLRKKLVAQLDDASRKAAEVAKKLVECQVRTAELQERMRVLLGKLDLK